MFLGAILPPSSGMKGRSGKKQSKTGAENTSCIQARRELTS
jgi:hypothetical protein